MAVEDAIETNPLIDATTGQLQTTPTNAQWTPDTVLSTLPHQPAQNTTSPLPFFHLLERLKTTKREGWRRFGISHGESIADHMYRMSILTLCCPASLRQRLDLPRCTQMALIHDMAESLVGDITPVDGVSKSEKSRREESTMDFLTKSLLGNVGDGTTGSEMRKVWLEYEESETLEAKFVHDIDKVELLLQTVEYERSHEGRIDLGEFTWVASKVVLPEMQEWAQGILKERDEYWNSIGKVPSNARQVTSDVKKEQMEEYYGKQNGA